MLARFEGFDPQTNRSVYRKHPDRRTDAQRQCLECGGALERVSRQLRRLTCYFYQVPSLLRYIRDIFSASAIAFAARGVFDVCLLCACVGSQSDWPPRRHTLLVKNGKIMLASQNITGGLHFGSLGCACGFVHARVLGRVQILHVLCSSCVAGLVSAYVA